MAGELRARNAAFLVKLEATEGVDANPTAADAILVEEVSSGVGTAQIPSTEITGAVDTAAPAVIGAPTTWTFRARVRGVSGTLSAGNLPPLDPVFQACGLERTLLTAVPQGAFTAGSATTATLSADHAATAQAYRGMPLEITAGSPHAGRFGAILDYTAGRVATLGETYAPPLSNAFSGRVPLCVRYAPRSANIPTVTCYHYQDGLLKRLVGARGTIEFQMDTAGVMVASVTLTGSWAGQVDAAIPPGIAPNGIAAPLFVQGAAPQPAFLLDRRPVGLSTFGIQLGNTIVSPPDPNTPNGFAGGLLTARDMRLTADPQAVSVATQNVVQDLLDGRIFPVVARAGSLVGNRLLVTVPAAQLLAAPDTDRDGVLARQMEMKATGPNAGLFLAVY